MTARHRLRHPTVRTLLSNLRARRRRVLGTGASVLLGVSFLVAALSFGSTVERGFAAMYDTANRATDVVVRSATVVGSDDGGLRDTIAESLADIVRAVPGVARVAPAVLTDGQLLDPHGARIGGNGPPTFAGNWVDDDLLNPYRLAEGRAPRDVAAGQPVEVVIDRRSAREAGLSLGDRTRLLLPDPVPVTVVGIATFGTADSMGPVTFTALAPQATATLLSTGLRAGQVDEIRVSARPGVDAAALRDSIRAALPAGTEAITGAELTAEQIDDTNRVFLDLFRAILTTFGVIAVVVASVSIYNTFSIVVAQRSRESALLRAVGASRRQVLALVLGESLAVGVIASLGGLAAGYGLSALLRWVMAATGAIDLGNLETIVETSTIVTGLCIGIGVTLVASLGPAIRSARTAPVEALRSAEAEPRRMNRWRLVVGTVVIGGGVAVVIASTRTQDSALLVAAGGSLLAIGGTLGVAPALVRPAATVLAGPGGRRRAAPGRIARQNVVRNPRRTANAAAALMIGTTVVALFATFGASLTASVERMVNRNFGGDLVVATRNQSSGGVSPTAAAEIAALPEVARTANFAVGNVRVGDQDEFASIVDPPALAALLDVQVASGSMDAMTPGTIAVSAQYARRMGVTVGSSRTVTFPDGFSVPVRVAAIYRDRSTMGDVVVNVADARAHLRSMPIVALLIDLRPGVSESAGAAAVDRVTTTYSAPEAQTRSEYVRSIASDVDGVLAFVYGLLGVAVVIAVLSIANTLALSIHERTRELGLLRALGQSRRQVRSMIRRESVVVAVFGALLGIGVGLFCGWGLMRAMAVQEGLGLFTAPVTTLATVAGLAIVAGVLAAIRPARRAAGVSILRAIAGAEEHAQGATA